MAEEQSILDTICKLLCGCVCGGEGLDDDSEAEQPMAAFSHTAEGQDFFGIRDECLRDGVLFEDPTFPNLDPSEVWRRPGEFVSNPKFKVKSFSRFDITQGCTNNCWFIVAVANLTQHKTHFERVVPMDNSDFDDETYAGIFHFRFWIYERWVEVVIDDRLPTMISLDGSIQLKYARSNERNEFWSALLEKAYAKLYGGYDVFASGRTAEAMQDFTGGVTEFFLLRKMDEHFFDLLNKRFQKKTLMMTEYSHPDNELSHAYSISDIRIEKSFDSDEPLKLIRLRNPWGDESVVEWEDDEPEAHRLPLEMLDRYRLSDYDADGEFWMTFEDFMSYFVQVQFCNVNLLSFNDGGHGNWRIVSFEGAWTEEMPAGNDQAAVCRNPQYKISLTEPDLGDKCTVVISLIQKFRRNQRDLEREHKRKGNLRLKFFIYRTDDEVTEDMESFEEYTFFINLREIAEKFELPVGNYTLIPCRHEPGESCEFLIRVFSKSYLNKM